MMTCRGGVRVKRVKPHLGVGVAALATAAALFYASAIYVFNPLTFIQDDVVYLPWSWYKAPLQLEYGVLDDEGWHFVRVSDVREIRSVYAELRKAITTSAPIGQETDPPGNRVWFGVRRMKDGAVLLDVKGQEGSSMFFVQSGGVPVVLTPALHQLIMERIELARQL